MTTKIDVPTGLVLAGAVALLASLFLDWFSPGLSGWNAFEALDLLLAALAAGAAAIAAGRLDRARPAPATLLPALSLAALLIVAVQLADPPPVAFDADREAGAWVALAGTLLMAAGSVLTVARVSVVVDVRGRDIRRRVPAVDARDSTPVGGHAPATPRAEPAAPGPAAARERDVDPDRTEPYDPLRERGGGRAEP